MIQYKQKNKEADRTVGTLERKLPGENVLSNIQSHYPKMSRSYRKIADYLTINYKEAVFMTASALAEELGTSESTVVRFASSLGYKGYPGFQDSLRTYIRSQYGITPSDGENPESPDDRRILESVFASDEENLRATKESLDLKAFRMAVQEIAGAERVYCLGLRNCAPLSEMCTFFLKKIRRNVFLMREDNGAGIYEDAIQLSPADVLIAIGFPKYSARMLKVMEIAGERNAHIISITDGNHSPMTMYSSCNLYAKTSPITISDSLTAPVYLINGLIAAVLAERPEAVSEYRRTVERAEQNYQIPEEDMELLTGRVLGNSYVSGEENA
ncbi:MAG: MurR/RpiR family transcriptional regulator [Lachnospiraceae bacterium]|nr:MurR/RpiR family transcriptional regulator [Lachnospiraceae bacterium]